MFRSLALIVSASLALTSGPALAGGYGGKRKAVSGAGISFGFDGGRHSRWSDDRYWARDSWSRHSGVYYGGRSGWGRSRGYDYDRYRHRKNDNTGDVVLGVVLGAVALGAIASANKDRRDRRGDGGSWIDPDGPRERVIVGQQLPAAVAEPAFDPALGSRQSASASCLQAREYTTTVTIGGEKVQAYGTACLQPDGSWLQGPSRTVPD